MKLSQDAFHHAKNYLFSEGRPLDQAVFSFTFEGGSKEAVLAELATFQNDDGGFGHGLEPDLRTPDSSALATSQALKTLRSIGLEHDHPMLKKTIGYLANTLDRENMVWPIIPESSQHSPHAFWWAYEGLEERFGHFLINPTVGLIGHLQHFSKAVPKELLPQLLEVSFARLDSLDVEGGIYDLFCYLDLFSANGVSEDVQAKLKDKISVIIEALVIRDPSKWGEHGLPPLAIAGSPDSLFLDVLGLDLVEKNLDFEIESQLEDGSWPVPWSWEAAYPKAWKQAEKDWKGFFIVQKLSCLRAFGRLAG